MQRERERVRDRQRIRDTGPRFIRAPFTETVPRLKGALYHGGSLSEVGEALTAQKVTHVLRWRRRSRGKEEGIKTEGRNLESDDKEAGK